MTVATLDRAPVAAMPSEGTPGHKLAVGHRSFDTHGRHADGNTIAPGQRHGDTQTRSAGGDTLTPGQPATAAQTSCAGGHLDAGQSTPDAHADRARVNTLTTGQLGRDTQQHIAGGNTSQELLFHAEFLDDMERVRIATENRARSMDAAGVDPAVYDEQVKALAAIEHQATLHLKRAMRRHPLGPWVKRTAGIGEKQGARLIAAIGDPYWNAADDRPRRGPAEFWAYCGYAPSQKRRKGVKSNWNATAKMRAFLCAEAAVKAGVRRLDGADDAGGYDVQHRTASTPYGATYLAARLSWADRDVADGHKHNHALRLVAKAILRDLWVESRDLHQGGDT